MYTSMCIWIFVHWEAILDIAKPHFRKSLYVTILKMIGLHRDAFSNVCMFYVVDDASRLDILYIA